MTFTHHLLALEASNLIGLVRTEPEREYLFHHALIQEAAYQSLVKIDRRFLHQQVAEAIERTYPDRVDALAFVLGRHWREAGNTDHARAYFMRAGAVAQKVYANQEAIAAYSEALDLTVDPAQRFDLLAERAGVYDVIAARAEQRADVDAMLALAEQLNDDTCRCDARIALAKFYLTTDYLRALEPAESAAAIAQAIGDPLREGRALYCQGVSTQVLRVTANLPKSRALLEEAASRLRKAGAQAETADCLGLLGAILADLNEPLASQQAIEEAVSLSRSAGDRRQAAINLQHLADLSLAQRHFDEALRQAQTALAYHRSLGDLANESTTLGTLGLIHAHLGQTEEAYAHQQQSLAVAERIGSSLSILNAINNLRQAHYLSQGEYEGGLKFVEAQLSKARQTRDQTLTALLESMQARLLADLGQFRQAIALRADGLSTRERILGRADRAGELALIACWQAEAGETESARQNLSEALQQAEHTQQWDRNGDLHLLAARMILLTADHGDDSAWTTALSHARQAIGIYMRSTENSSETAPLISAYTLIARLHLAGGEVAEALAHSTRAVQLAAANFPAPRQEQYWYTHSLALRAAQRETEADAWLQKAYERVMLVADRTSDPALRSGWLENVRDNRRLVAEWESRRRR
jgi:tetratricopeptide (TPR) repeat protein